MNIKQVKLYLRTNGFKYRGTLKNGTEMYKRLSQDVLVSESSVKVDGTAILNFDLFRDTIHKDPRTSVFNVLDGVRQHGGETWLKFCLSAMLASSGILQNHVEDTGEHCEGRYKGKFKQRYSDMQKYTEKFALHIQSELGLTEMDMLNDYIKSLVDLQRVMMLLQANDRDKVEELAKTLLCSYDLSVAENIIS